MAYERCCSFQILLFKLLGIWPADRKWILLHLLQKFYLYFQMTCLFLLSLSLLSNAYFSKDLKNISSTVDICTLTLSSLYKAWFVCTHIQQFQNLIGFMRREFKASIHNQNGDIISIESKNKNSPLYTSLLCFGGFLTIMFFGIAPILEYKDHIESSNSTEELFRQIKFPFQTWIPFDVYWSPMYEVVYILQCFAGVCSSNIYLVNDSFLFTMINLIFIQMEMLKEMLTNIGKGKFDYMDEPLEILPSNGKSVDIITLQKKSSRHLINDDVQKLNLLEINSGTVNSTRKTEEIQVENEISLKLKTCIIFHSKLLNAIMAIEKLNRSMILVDVLHAIISLSFALHETGVTDFLFNRIKMYLFLFICIVHQLGNSYFGQMLLNAQEMIFTAAHNMQWVDTNIQTKKWLILILARSNKFTTLNGGKMYLLRFESFVMFMKTLFSYYMVLRQASTE